MRHISRLALAAAFLAAPALAQGGDPVAGEKAFKKCAACHSIEPGAASKIGPNLYGVVGRATGALEDFKYSDTMSKAGQEGHVWTVGELDIYLENPRAAMPGNKMTFVGLRKRGERADVISYLVSLNPGGAGAAAPAEAAPAN